MALVIISFFIFVTYIAVVLLYICHIPCSLSETYYYLGSRIYPSQGWEADYNIARASIFTFTMWAMAFTLLPGMLGLTPEPYKFICFLTTAGICFVGAAPQFLEKSEGRVHTAGAVVSAVFGILWSILVGGMLGVAILIASAVILLLVALISRTLEDCSVFWFEMIAFFTVYLTTICLLL